jgi:ornithine cyclodeaminase/alanine dehydrogenase-like protein (mu-crystallin family)
VLAGAELVVVDTRDALSESGDLLAASQAGLHESKVALLADYLADSDRAIDGRVVYKSIGSVEQDLSLAAAVWEQAERRGIGDAIEPIEQPRA